MSNTTPIPEAAPARAAAPLIEMVGIDKAFPGVRALHNARFELRAGEVHALMGENGAGKSTLMKVLSGVYQRDAGEIRLNGQSIDASASFVGFNTFPCLHHVLTRERLLEQALFP